MENIKQQNIELLSKYEPKGVLYYFANLCNIPHGSHNEAAISKYIADVLRPVCKEVKLFEDGTVYAYKEATSGYENLKTVCLQAHSDMVCVKKTNSNHDFKKDPLTLEVKDGWINAKDTTLGADNGMGVAYILDIFINKDAQHGPIEALITTAEETNMQGANLLTSGLLKADYMINLDHEDTHSFCIGCEGGIDISLINKFERTSIEGLSENMTITIQHGVAGHSGNDIRKKIINANKLMFELLLIARNKYKFSLVDATGGIAKNVITPDCTVNIAINPNEYDNIKKILEDEFNHVKKEFFEREHKITIEISKKPLDIKPAKLEFSDKMINVWNSMFNGIYYLSETYPISEGSSNWGLLKTDGDSFVSSFLVRSLYGTSKPRIANRIISAFYGTGYQLRKNDDYPQWTPILGGNLLQEKYIEVYHKLFGKDPKCIVTEGGVEAGVIIDKYPHLVALSMGPSINAAHTFNEKAYIKDVKSSYIILNEILKSIDKK